MMHLLAMGKYAAYVWPAYGASFVGLASVIGFTFRGYVKAKRRLKVLEQEGATQ